MVICIFTVCVYFDLFAVTPVTKILLATSKYNDDINNMRRLDSETSPWQTRSDFLFPLYITITFIVTQFGIQISSSALGRRVVCCRLLLLLLRLSPVFAKKLNNSLYRGNAYIVCVIPYI